MERAPPDFNLERALRWIPYVTPGSVSGNPRLENLLRASLDQQFQSFTSEDLSRYLPTRVKTALVPQQVCPQLSNRPLLPASLETAPSSTNASRSHQLALQSRINKATEEDVNSKRSGKRNFPDETTTIPPEDQKTTKRRRRKRTELSQEVIKKGKSYLTGRRALERISIDLIWDDSRWRSASLRTLGGQDESLNKEEVVVLEVEKPLKICGMLWKENKKNLQEMECTRRFLILLISHMVEHCESLPEIPHRKLHGRSARTYAYQIASQETGESTETLKVLLSFSKKYFALARGAGLSRLLEIQSGKAWFWEKSMTQPDIAQVCLSLRSGHKDMDEDEKKQRSELDFKTSQGFIHTFYSWGISRETLINMKTTLTETLRMFVDFEGLRDGELKPNNKSFYHSDEFGLIEGPHCLTSQGTSLIPHLIPSQSDPGHRICPVDFSPHLRELSVQQNHNVLGTNITLQPVDEGDSCPPAWTCNSLALDTSPCDRTRSMGNHANGGLNPQSEDQRESEGSSGSQIVAQSCDSQLQSDLPIRDEVHIHESLACNADNTAANQWLESLHVASGANVTTEDGTSLQVNQSEEFTIFSDWAHGYGFWFDSDRTITTFEGW